MKVSDDVFVRWDELPCLEGCLDPFEVDNWATFHNSEDEFEAFWMHNRCVICYYNNMGHLLQFLDISRIVVRHSDGLAAQFLYHLRCRTKEKY